VFSAGTPPPATTTQNNQLVFEQEILRDHGSDATGATWSRDHHDQMQQHQQEIPHVGVRLRQASGAVQRC
jgi:hypothetical protein